MIKRRYNSNIIKLLYKKLQQPLVIAKGIFIIIFKIKKSLFVLLAQKTLKDWATAAGLGPSPGSSQNSSLGLTISLHYEAEELEVSDFVLHLLKHLF